MSEGKRDRERARLSRREFVRAGAATLGGAALARGFARVWAQAAGPVKPSPVPRRKLGNTGLDLPVVSVGTVTGPVPAVILRALEWGMNFVHTSTRYSGGKAILQVAKAIKGKRDQFILGYKFYGEDDLDKGLRLLGTDYVDILFFHSTKPEIVTADIADRFQKLKQAGKIRFFGLTSHGSVDAVMKKGLELGFFNALMPRYNLANRDLIDPIIAEGAKKGMGGVVMKSWDGLKGKDYRPFWASILQKPHWTTICKGPKTVADIDTWGQFALNPQAYASEALVEQYAAACRGVTCLACGRCTAVCENGVNPCEILRCEMYAVQYGEVKLARALYTKLPPESTALACRDCGTCSAVCPGGLAVAERIRRVHRLLA